MNSLIKPFEWIEHEGKRYATQEQFAAFMGVRTDNLKRWLKQHKVNVLNLSTIKLDRRILYPYEFVSTVVLTHEVKSDFGKTFKKYLLSQLTQPRELPKQEVLQLAPPKASRDQLRETVAIVATHYDIPYNEIWHKLWTELYYRCHVNVKLQAKNKAVKPLDIIVKLELCSVSIAIIKENYAEAFNENL